MRILLVDDDPLVLRALAREVGRSFELRSVSSAIEALDLLALTEFDVVVTDYHLAPTPPSGLDVLSLVYELHPRARRILITGCADRAVGDARRRGLVHHVVDKPWPPGYLRGLLVVATIE